MPIIHPSPAAILPITQLPPGYHLAIISEELLCVPRRW